MNKVVVRNVGYNFNEENLEFIESLDFLSRINLIYILPNYLQLENNRNLLAERLGAIRAENIMTFDDLAYRFFPYKDKIINKEKSSWIIKKILEKEDFENISSSLGTAKDILGYIQVLKSNKINSIKYNENIKEFDDLKNIGLIFDKYEMFLKDNNLFDEVDVYYGAIEELKAEEIKIGNVIINGFLEFRPHELALIDNLKKLSNSITIQYPYKKSNNNIKFNKTLSELKDLNFTLEIGDVFFYGDNQKIGYELMNINENASYNQNVEVIRASNKYYEVSEVIRNINSKLEDYNVEDISIIASPDYEILIKNIAKEYEIPISIMNEESGRNIPIVRSLINFLEFILEDKKTKLVSVLNDENINLVFDIDFKEFTQKFIEFEYLGLDYNYKNSDIEFEKNLNNIKRVVDKFKKFPIKSIEEFINNEDISNELLSSYLVHEDIEILKTSLKGVEIIKKSIEEVNSFANLINISGKEVIEVLIYYLNNINYYISRDKKGIIVTDYINSLGSESKVRYILGLNSNFPKLRKTNYLFSKRFDKLFKNLGINVEREYENIDNITLQISQAIASGDNLIFSYVFPDVKLCEESSIYLKDYIKRIKDDCVIYYKSVSMTKEEISYSAGVREKLMSDLYSHNKNLNPEVQLNYITREEELIFNNFLNKYYSRKDILGKYWGKLNNFEAPANIYYSQGMLDSYNICPFKYYMEYVLFYEELSLDYFDDFFIERGNLYHKILYTLYKIDDVLNVSEEELEDIVISRVDEYLNNPYKNSDELKVQKSIFSEKLIELIINDRQLHSELKESYVPKIFEKRLEKEIDKFKVYGIVDRIDLNEDNSAIIYDYKSGRSPSRKSVLNLENIQLPIYSYLYGLDSLSGAFFGELKDRKIKRTFHIKDIFVKGSYTGNSLTKEELITLIDDTESRIKEIIKRINDGLFIVKPINKENCEYCEYNEICRKEELPDGF